MGTISTGAPTMMQFRAMVAMNDALNQACIAADDAIDLAAWKTAAKRSKRSWQALLDARSTDPRVLAAWVRWLVKELEGSSDLAPQLRPGLEHVADQLEALAVPQPA